MPYLICVILSTLCLHVALQAFTDSGKQSIDDVNRLIGQRIKEAATQIGCMRVWQANAAIGKYVKKAAEEAAAGKLKPKVGQKARAASGCSMENGGDLWQQSAYAFQAHVPCRASQSMLCCHTVNPHACGQRLGAQQWKQPCSSLASTRGVSITTTTHCVAGDCSRQLVRVDSPKLLCAVLCCCLQATKVAQR